jgi:hypothetical protein
VKNPELSPYHHHHISTMCKYTYHHYPLCGHISNWTVASCLEFTHRIRALSFTGQVLFCDKTKIKHNINQKAKQDLCAQCDLDWCEAVTAGSMDALLEKKYRTIEGLDAERPVLEFAVRMNVDANSVSVESCPSSPGTRDGTSEQSDVFADFDNEFTPPDSSCCRLSRDAGHWRSGSSLSIEGSGFTLSITDESTQTDSCDNDPEPQLSSDSQRHRRIRIRYRKGTNAPIQNLNSAEDSPSVYSRRVCISYPPTPVPDSRSSTPGNSNSSSDCNSSSGPSNCGKSSSSSDTGSSSGSSDFNRSRSSNKSSSSGKPSSSDGSTEHFEIDVSSKKSAILSGQSLLGALDNPNCDSEYSSGEDQQTKIPFFG